MTPSVDDYQSLLKRESALLLGCLLVGLLVLPIAIYMVGNVFFGDYEGGGLAVFYSTLHADVRQFDPVVWFLVVSPYLVLQLLRATVALFRRL